MKLPKITEKTIKEHIKAVNEPKFKSRSNKAFEIILKENPELAGMIITTLESKKSEEYKKGYLAGLTTIYDILRRQANKSK
jgi:hypothetical protein